MAIYFPAFTLVVGYLCEVLISVQTILKGLMEENFKQHLEFVERNPIMYGDFRTALEEAEPRLYEDVQDYEATKAIFQEVRFNTLSLSLQGRTLILCV